MKENFVHVCFIIDESGSMSSSVKDVLGGFKSVIDEQRENNKGTCAVSMFKFATKAVEVFKGRDVNEVEYITEENYRPGGFTAMNDGIGLGIDTIGEWLSGMPEDQRPEKNIIVIMTDGEENNSVKYRAEDIKAKIKHQEDKYSWSFIYMGTDITNMDSASSIGIANAVYTVRNDYATNYTAINSVITTYRDTCGDAKVKNLAAEQCLSKCIDSMNADYELKTGIKTKSSNKISKA